MGSYGNLAVASGNDGPLQGREPHYQQDQGFILQQLMENKYSSTLEQKWRRSRHFLRVLKKRCRNTDPANNLKRFLIELLLKVMFEIDQTIWPTKQSSGHDGGKLFASKQR